MTCETVSRNVNHQEQLQTVSTTLGGTANCALVQATKPSPTLADLLGVLLESKGSNLHVQLGHHGTDQRGTRPILIPA